MRISATKLSATVIAAGLAAASSALAADSRDRGDARGLAVYAAGEPTGIADYTQAGYIQAGYIQMVRLDAKDPDTQHGRGTRQQTKEQSRNDLYQIIVYYNAAIKRDPRDDDAYFHRGLAKFYAGALVGALADLSQASRLDPQYAYYALWIDIIDKRHNEASSLPQAISRLNMAKWPAPVVRLFLGETTPEAVLAAADDPDPVTKKGQICEANFYNAEFALQQGAMAEASRLFRLAAAGCPREFVEGPAANSELAALDASE